MKRLNEAMGLRETLRWTRVLGVRPQSRFQIGSPCKFIRKLDLLIHILIPELIEQPLPGLARRLRKTSPRWGQSWRGW
jgi:hypothetical protein